MSMIHSISTKDMSREEWLEERKNSLGGSDMGAILGLNKYRSPFAVWAEKTGLIDAPEDNEAMRIGRDLEDYVAQRFAEKSGYKVRRRNAILRNDDFPHIHANIDREIVGEAAGLECKTASAFSTKLYRGEEFPESYYAQCVTYMAVTGFGRYYLAVLILGREFKVYQLTRHKNDTCPEWCESCVYISEEEINALRKAAVEFWEGYIEKRVAPAFDGSSSTTDSLNSIYSRSTAREMELIGRDDLMRQWFRLNDDIKALQERKEVVRQQFMSDMKEAERAICGEHKISWKPQKRTSYDMKRLAKEHPEIDFTAYAKVTESRVFKIS